MLPCLSCRPAPENWGGRPEWLLRFGWRAAAAPPGAAAAGQHPGLEPARPAPLRLVQVLGAPPEALRKLVITRNGELHYQVNSVALRNGYGVAAGLLVAAVARTCGHIGLVLDLPFLGVELDWGGFSLSLRLEADAVGALQGVGVVAEAA